MKIYVRQASGTLVPSTEEDLYELRQLRPDRDYLVTVTLARNARFHRKFFALLKLTLDNLPESIQEQTHIYSVEAMLTAVKIDLGHFDTVTIGDREAVKLRSISFSKMNEEEFERFYDLAVTDILNNYLRGTDRQGLMEEVEQFISQRY